MKAARRVFYLCALSTLSVVGVFPALGATGASCPGVCQLPAEPGDWPVCNGIYVVITGCYSDRETCHEEVCIDPPPILHPPHAQAEASLRARLPSVRVRDSCVPAEEGEGEAPTLRVVSVRDIPPLS